MKEPHGDDTGGGWEKGRSNALGRQEGAEESAAKGDMDAKAREADHRRTNAWIKGGKMTD